MNSACKTGGHTTVLLQTAAAALLAIASGQATAASVTLCAEPYSVDLPGAPGVPMWGYRQVSDASAVQRHQRDAAARPSAGAHGACGRHHARDHAGQPARRADLGVIAGQA